MELAWPNSLGCASSSNSFGALGCDLARQVRFAQRNSWYSISESLEAVLYPRVLGLGRIETTEPLRSNGMFHGLAGLPGYPDLTTLRRFCRAALKSVLAHSRCR